MLGLWQLIAIELMAPAPHILLTKDGIRLNTSSERCVAVSFGTQSEPSSFMLLVWRFVVGSVAVEVVAVVKKPCRLSTTCRLWVSRKYLPDPGARGSVCMRAVQVTSELRHLPKRKKSPGNASMINSLCATWTERATASLRTKLDPGQNHNQTLQNQTQKTMFIVQ